MNAVEIEEAISNFAAQPFDAEKFPFAFLESFGNKPTTIKRLKSVKNSSNRSDVKSGVLQRNNIHIAVCVGGDVNGTLTQLRESLATSKGKVKIILATDGVELVAEDLLSGETVACPYSEFANHFGFFLSLAGISTTREIRNNPVDIQATGRLNRLYIELLKNNKDWDTEERRHDMNQFMSRLIFCFFAEDTGIFPKDNMFVDIVEKMSDSRSGNTDFVVAKIFHAMDVKHQDRDKEDLPNWTREFPYVNGGLFAGTRDVPKFNRIARSYLIHAGNLNWKHINPDIFGSMIQAVADDEERGAIGMHYTSVPNILKLLNPLFLDNLRDSLKEADDSQRKLLNLRKRISKIRVFDPACGSGNFLVIAYKEMRAIESEINSRRNESHIRSVIPLSNFRGIELREFATEVARLALIIAEYQCDELYRGQQDALADFLPLDSKNWIVHGNALKLDWLSICPPVERSINHLAEDLFHDCIDQAQIDFENEGGETYICGNPPYQGSVNQSVEQKADMQQILSKYLKAYKDLDYVSCWFVKSAEYSETAQSPIAFVTTNSICQGEQVGMLWPILFEKGQKIFFAHTSFQWKNNASNNAGVMCNVIGLQQSAFGNATIYDAETAYTVKSIGPYLTPGSETIVNKSSSQISSLPHMVSGNKATDGGNLILNKKEARDLINQFPAIERNIKRLQGAKEFIRGESRWCLWLDDKDLPLISEISNVKERVERVRYIRKSSRGKQANEAAATPHRFVYSPHQSGLSLLVPSVSSERREFLPCGLFDDNTVIVAPNLVMYGAPIWCLAIIASRIHLTWIATVCGKLKTDFRYSNTLGWNTFPVPRLTEKNKQDLACCAEGILLSRESHFPATIADLYRPENMPDNLRQAHERNDETLERIYIGRRFSNDTERLEKLFELYTKMSDSSKKAIVKVATS